MMGCGRGPTLVSHLIHLLLLQGLSPVLCIEHRARGRHGWDAAPVEARSELAAARDQVVRKGDVERLRPVFVLLGTRLTRDVHSRRCCSSCVIIGVSPSALNSHRRALGPRHVRASEPHRVATVVGGILSLGCVIRPVGQPPGQVLNDGCRLTGSRLDNP